MKLLIKKKYFEQIKNGSKTFDFRDAHITFICDEIHEQITRKVISCGVGRRDDVLSSLGAELTPEEADKLFTDDEIIYFALE